MPADEPELRERLRILTAALEGFRPRDGQVPRHKVLSATKTFVHLAQLLDTSFTNAFAMTGSAGFPTSEMVLVASISKKPGPAPDAGDHPAFAGVRNAYTVVTLRPRVVPQDEWKEGRIQDSDEIDTKMLAETLLWTWQRLSTLSRGKIRTQFLQDAFQWFHRAGWRRYRSRLVRTTALEWETSPIDTLKTWKPETEDEVIFSGCEGRKLRVSAAQAPHFESLHPESEGEAVVVTFRFRDAVLWAQLIFNVLYTCRTTMDQPPSRDGQPPGFRHSVALLPLLSLLLRFLPIKVLLARSSLAMQFHRKHALDADVQGKFEAETEGEPTDDVVERIGEFVNEDVDEEDEDVGPGIRLNGLLVFRFFETLVAPLRALAHLSKRTLPPDDPRPPIVPPDVQVKLVTLAPPRSVEEDIWQDLLDQVRDELKQKAKSKLGDPSEDNKTLRIANDWIDRFFTKETVKPTASTARRLQPKLKSFTGNVHAEAGLMALSYLEPHIMMHDPGERPLPIGVSKKCCWTCWKLGLLLRSGDSPHEFDLPGSHGTIYAWNPPDFGIPVTALTSLCDALYDKAVEAAIADAGDRKSQASSPASESGSLPDAELSEGGDTFVSFAE